MAARKSDQLVRTRKAVATADLLEAEDAQARAAFELRQAGKSWWAIAEELGITEGAARVSVDRAVRMVSEMVSDHAKRSLLVTEISRLDALQTAYWGDATQWRTVHETGPDGEDRERREPPNMRAAEFVLKVIAQRSKLLGLDDMSHAAVSHQTVIVAGTSEEYIAALRSVAEPRTIEGIVEGD